MLTSNEASLKAAFGFAIDSDKYTFPVLVVSLTSYLRLTDPLLGISISE